MAGAGKLSSRNQDGATALSLPGLRPQKIAQARAFSTINLARAAAVPWLTAWQVVCVNDRYGS